MSENQITISPIDDSVYVERPLASTDDIHNTFAAASQAQKIWSKTSVSKRAKICYDMVTALVANADEAAEQICWMMGRPIRFAKGEISGMAERATYMIETAESALQPITLPEKDGLQRFIKREPLGNIFVIAPWNYPYLTAINAIIPAIMAGNCVVLKASAQTPLCAEQFAKAFKQAGLPDGVFQYLHMSHAETERVIREEDIQFVAFTGSVAGGAMVEQAMAGRFIGAGLELGGKDPAYVMADADVSHAAEALMDGAFFNSGQSCCGIERIYVDAQVFDEFIDQSVNIVMQYKLGRSDNHETTLGPMVRASAAEFVRDQINQAISEGAIPHIDPKSFAQDKVGTAYLAPQILTNVNHNMSIMTEESFGPVVGIMKVHSTKEAINLMNDSEYGLTASVFSKDIKQAIAIGEQINTGTFFVNRCDYLDPALAWTGVKQSGRGCTLSRLGYDYLTRPKSFHIKS